MLSDRDILALLGDGDVSDIGSEVDDTEEDECFPIDELDKLIDDFESTDLNDLQSETQPGFNDLLSEIEPSFSNSNPAPEKTLENIESEFISTNKRDIRWVQKAFQPPIINLENIDSEYIDSIKTPIEYFLEYFGEKSFEEMAFFTNLYATRSNLCSKFKPTDQWEMKTLIGIHILMGCLKFPRTRMYWQKGYIVNLIADNMSRNRFFLLRNYFHVIDNNEIPRENKDKFIKVRPLYNSFLDRCKMLQVERCICVDEQIVPFKGQLSVKQYIKNKPIKWGIKIFLLCGESGLIYNFLLFQGFFELPPNNLKSYGCGGSTVLYLTKDIKPNRHFLFFDNYFSTFGLFEKLLHKKIYAVGTIRVNWFANPPFISDKLMRQLGRGTHLRLLQIIRIITILVYLNGLIINQCT